MTVFKTKQPIHTSSRKSWKFICNHKIKFSDTLLSNSYQAYWFSCKVPNQNTVSSISECGSRISGVAINTPAWDSQICMVILQNYKTWNVNYLDIRFMRVLPCHHLCHRLTLYIEPSWLTIRILSEYVEQKPKQ